MTKAEWKSVLFAAAGVAAGAALVTEVAEATTAKMTDGNPDLAAMTGDVLLDQHEKATRWIVGVGVVVALGAYLMSSGEAK